MSKAIISFPYEVRLGFVLYDTTLGGNGILTELALCGDSQKDSDRANLIRSIILHANEICSKCTCCNAINPDLPPATFTQALQDQEHFRLSAGCFNCLRDYSNQAEHTKLDRYDAVRILEYILNPIQE